MSDSFQNYVIQPASAFDPALGLNVSADDPAATLLAQLSALGLHDVRASATTAAETSTLATLAARGIAIDLVLAPGQSVASLIAVAGQIDARTPNAVATLEGPDLVADPAYTYDGLSGDAAGDQASADLVSAVASASGLGTVATIAYSTSIAATATAQATPTYLDINPGDVALSSPAAALSAAQDAATIGANTASPQYVVANLGGSSPATLLDGLLDAQFRFGFSSVSSTSGTVTTYTTVLPPTYLAAASAAANSPAALTAGGTLTAAGAAFVNLGALISSGPAGTYAGGTLSLSVAPYEQGVQYDENVEVFAGPGGSADVLVWGDEEAPSTSGHGRSVIQFGTAQSLVQVFDPTQGTAAVASFANLSELDITNSPDGPLVIRVSGTAASGTGTVGTYAGVVAPASTGGTSTTGTGTSTTGTGTSTTGTGTSTTGTGTSTTGTGTSTTGTGTSTTGTSTGGTSTAGTTTSLGVVTIAGASGTTFVTPAAGSSTVAASATGNDVVNSRGTDTISAGGGTDIVYASGAAATVSGGTGSLVFVAGSGAYVAGGGTGSDTLYGGSGANTLTGGAGAVGSILVAGSGNATLAGGAGTGAVMFGGPSATSFLGSTGGGDTMVGGTGANTFSMTQGGVAFGGPASADTFFTGTGSALVVEGGGPTTLVLGAGHATMFAGSGVDTYVVTEGLAAQAGIVGFKAGDHLDLSGFTAAQASTALSSAATGTFGTILALPDGTRITLYGSHLSAAQITTA